MEGISGSDILLPDLSTPPVTHNQPISAPPPLREKNKRPQLSCNPCRARKVKCDRIQPCSACSLHQIAEICHYDLSETERQPILQAEALKEKDKTIGALRQEVAGLRGDSLKVDNDDHSVASQKVRLPPRSDGRQQQDDYQALLQGAEGEPLPFGESGVMHMANDFNHLSFHRAAGSSVRQSQQHPHRQPHHNHHNYHHHHPQDVDIFSIQLPNPYPFPTLWTAQDDTSSLTRLLPPEQDLFFYLESFERRSILFSFPHLPEEVTGPEVGTFLQNLDQNAARSPSHLALLFTSISLGLHDGVFDKLGEKWATGSMETESQRGEIYIAAAMQCLRLSAFTSRPSFMAIQALVMMGHYLTYSGKFLDAVALFGLTVRLAQAIGLHRDPGQLRAQMSNKEAIARQNLWWWMLFMDQQYSVTLGRPSAISMIGDCPAPSLVPADSARESILGHVGQFTILSREILFLASMDNDSIDQATDKLLLLQKSLPPIVQFDVTWLGRERPHVGWPLDVQAAILHAKTHNLIISLNRRRTESPVLLGTNNMVGQVQPDADIEGSPRGRPRVLLSCRALLQGFEFFRSRLKAGLVSWTMGQMAFNASMLLTLSMLETGETQDLLPVQHAYSTFLEMNKLGIHKLAGAAVERLGRLMKEFGTDDSENEKVMGGGGMLLLEDPGCHKLVLEGPRLRPGAHGNPDIAKVNSTPPQRTRLSQQRRRQAKRANNFRDSGVSKSRRSSFGKSQRPHLDRRFSDSVAPKSTQRRRLNRSTPNLSLLTSLSDHDVFSSTSTPVVKTESMFPPTAVAFDSLPHSAFPLTGPSGGPDGRRMLTDIPNEQIAAYSVDPQHPSQTQFMAQPPHQQAHMQQHEHELPLNDNSNVLSRDTMSTPLQSVNTESQTFDFSSTSTPYSAEFFDGGLAAVVGQDAFDEQSLTFNPLPFSSAPPFSMSSEAEAFVAAQF